MFAISKTFLTSFDADDPLTVDGFIYVRNDREGKDGEGIAIYLKSIYPVKISLNLILSIETWLNLLYLK